MLKDEEYMTLALGQARLAQEQGEVPIGAIIINEAGEIIASGFNEPIKTHDPCAHAEIVALREAAQKLGNYRLVPNLTLYVTLEPCTMCAGAISHARIARLVYGAQDAKGGAIENGVRFYESANCHHRPEIVSGVLNEECGAILKEFFAKKRKKPRQQL